MNNEGYRPELDRRRDLQSETDKEKKIKDLRAALEALPLDQMTRPNVMKIVMDIFTEADMKTLKENLETVASMMHDLTPKKSKTLGTILEEE